MNQILSPLQTLTSSAEKEPYVDMMMSTMENLNRENRTIISPKLTFYKDQDNGMVSNNHFPYLYCNIFKKIQIKI